MKPDLVQQGETYDFCQTLEGLDTDDFTYQLDVKQFPDDAAAISRALTDVDGSTVSGTLTAAETAALDIGLWYMIITSTDPDEVIKKERRISITKNWV